MAMSAVLAGRREAIATLNNFNARRPLSPARNTQMHWIIETFWLNRTYNDTFTLLLYWLPLLANAIAYPIRVYWRVQRDKAAIRGEIKYHSDWLKFGDLVGYAAATVIPLANLCFFVFDTMGDLWRMLWHRLDWLFSFRLVRGNPPE